jgi:WD40 repeat protein
MTIRIWNLTTFATIKSWKNHSQAIFCLALLNNGFLASGSQDRTIKIWNTSNNFQLVYTIYDLSSVFVLLPLPDGRLLSATGSVINVWNTNSNYSLIASLKGHYLSILSLRIFSDNTTLISGSIDNTIKIWDIRSFKLLNTLNTQSAVNSLEVFNGKKTYSFFKFV